jgi:cellulose synthase/poly-beta-1,6-N-acetylglucosamine synthase-like glycosyltransferase
MIIGPWSRNIDLGDPWFALLCYGNATIWVIILWWASHHLTFQLASMFRKPVPIIDQASDSFSPVKGIRFVIAYMTCDDFMEAACLSCLKQRYDSQLFRVLICDDSEKEQSRTVIDHFVAIHGATAIRRATRHGFKAGNLNNAVFDFTSLEDEWIVVVDADQTLPINYLDLLANAAASEPSQTAFIQCAHSSDHILYSEDQIPKPKDLPTAFQIALGNEIDIFYQRSMPMRNRFGFVPFLGHGAAIRRASLARTGGLPLLVSEDYAFSLKLRLNGEWGTYIELISSFESFPKNFGALVVRLGKFAGGSAELLRSASLEFFRSEKVSLTEKIDFLMLHLWYPLSTLAFLNSYLSGYVCYRL